MEEPIHKMSHDGYPTEQFLEWIEKYDVSKGDPFWFIQIILDEWYHGDYGWRIQRQFKGERTIYISTLGWSGNEDMMYALEKNFMFWTLFYYSHRRGGHYVFKLRKIN